MKAYEEIIEFFAAGTTASALIAFQPSEAAKARIAELIEQEKINPLTPEDRSELEHFLQLEHLMRLAKARAHCYTCSEDGD